MVAGSNPVAPTLKAFSEMLFAEIAQLVEHNLAKVGVASSNLVSRSIKFCPSGGMVDARDLKSLGSFYRTGSSPVSGTTKTATWPSGKA